MRKNINAVGKAAALIATKKYQGVRAKDLPCKADLSFSLSDFCDTCLLDWDALMATWRSHVERLIPAASAAAFQGR